MVSRFSKVIGHCPLPPHERGPGLTPAVVIWVMFSNLLDASDTLLANTTADRDPHVPADESIITTKVCAAIPPISK